MAKGLIAALAGLVVILAVACSQSSQHGITDQIQLSSILPKLQAIHEDSKNLLLKNSELKAQIQAGAKLQAANGASASSNQQQSIKRNPQQMSAAAAAEQQQKTQPPAPGLTVSSATKPVSNVRVVSPNGAIDYIELEEFNEWVDANLDYAVKNTRASIDALKEEAQLNNGTIEYSEQAVQDGIEGVRYWKSAVLFQDKTLKNERFVVEE